MTTAATSIIEGYDGSIPAATVLDADPLFVDRAAGDYRLAFGSPALEAGTNSFVGSMPTPDALNNPRIVDADRDGVATIDLGAIEAPPLPGCNPADLAAQLGSLDVNDILTFAALVDAGCP